MVRVRCPAQITSGLKGPGCFKWNSVPVGRQSESNHLTPVLLYPAIYRPREDFLLAQCRPIPLPERKVTADSGKRQTFMTRVQSF